MKDRFYSTADLARVCGVSISTVKRWTDAGLLRCVRTPGGHRKYRVQDVAEAGRKLGLSIVDTEVRPAAQVDELALLLLQGNHAALAALIAAALRNGDTARARGIALDLHRHGLRLAESAALVARAWHELVAPAAAPDFDAFMRRRAEQCAVATLRSLLDQTAVTRAATATALLAAAPGTGDAVTPLLVHVMLAERGWRVVDLGSDVAPDVVRGGLRAEHPALFVLVHAGLDAGLGLALGAEARAQGAEWVAIDAGTHDALALIAAHVAERERRVSAAMV